MKKLVLLLTPLVVLCCSPAGSVDFELWVHPCLVPMSRGEEPPEMPVTVLEMKLAPGEYEPAAFAVRSEKPFEAGVRLIEGSLPADWCSLYSVESLADSTDPNRLYPLAAPVGIDSADTRFFWITVHAPEDAAPGRYSSRVAVEAGGRRSELDLSCEVYPFRLEDNRITAGVFMCLADLPPGWYRDMKQHGLDAIQFFTWEWVVRDSTRLRRRGEWAEEPIRLTNRDGRLVLDFTAMDRIMKQINEAGMKGPVTVSLGNDRFMHYECRIAQVMGLKIDTTRIQKINAIGPPVTPRLDSFFISGLRQLHEHWKQMGWPQELVILIYDEPTHGLLERGKHRYDMIKKNFPDTRVYGVVMDKRGLAEQVAPQCDILVANGDFDGVREVALKNGKDFYVYGSMGPVNYARFRMGCMPWRVRGSGAFFWMYNYWFYSDRCAVYQHKDKWEVLVPSVQWECVREGVDDLRYFATAEKMIENLPEGRREQAAALLEQVRGSIDPHYRSSPGRRGREMSGEELLEYRMAPQRVREKVVEIILGLN